MLSMTARDEYREAVKRLKALGAESNEEMIAILAHELRQKDEALNKFYSYRNPIPNKWIHEVDTGTDMLKCPKCECRVKAGNYSYAVADRGYGFCPYCGEDLRKEKDD